MTSSKPMRMVDSRMRLRILQNQLPGGKMQMVEGARLFTKITCFKSYFMGLGIIVIIVMLRDKNYEIWALNIFNNYFALCGQQNLLAS